MTSIDNSPESIIHKINVFKKNDFSILIGGAATLVYYFLLAISDLIFLHLHKKAATTNKSVYCSPLWWLNAFFKYIFLAVIDIIAIYITPAEVFTCLGAIYPIVIIFGKQKEIRRRELQAFLLIMAASIIFCNFYLESPITQRKVYMKTFVNSLHNIPLYVILPLTALILVIYIFVHICRNNTKATRFFFSVLMCLSILSVINFLITKVLFGLATKKIGAEEPNLKKFLAEVWPFWLIVLGLKIIYIFIFDKGIKMYKEKYIKYIMDVYTMNITVSEVVVFVFFRCSHLYEVGYIYFFYVGVILSMFAINKMHSSDEQIIPCCCKHSKPCCSCPNKPNSCKKHTTSGEMAYY